MAYWTCLRSETRREAVAVRHLQMNGYQIYLPRLRVWRVTRGRKIEIHPPLFPNYLFVWIELQWYSARWCPGVASMILDGIMPARVPDVVIDELRGRERNGLIELPRKQDLQRGDRVKILHGPFSGHLAIFSDTKPRERIEVLLALLGSQQRVELPRSNVEVIRPS